MLPDYPIFVQHSMQACIIYKSEKQYTSDDFPVVLLLYLTWGYTVPGALILSTGNAVFGTTSTNTAGNSGQGNAAGAKTDTQLSALATAMGYPSMSLYDTAILEFDFVPSVSGDISFAYVFGSEEYPEYSRKSLCWQCCCDHALHAGYKVEVVK